MSDKGPSISLDSFLDVLTCLQGVLMLVIISTGIDAAQTKVLIPTPIETQSNKRPTYYECRGNLIYPMDIAGLAKQARATMTQISLGAAGDQMKLMQAITETRVTNDFYEVDLSYYMLGRLVIKPRKDATAQGHVLEENATFATDNFMVRELKDVDETTQRIVLIVRDDSFQVFKVAQRLAFLAKMETMVEVYDVRELLFFSQSAALTEGS